MTKKLEEMMDLPESKNEIEEEKSNEKSQKKKTKEKNLEKPSQDEELSNIESLVAIKKSLPTVKGLGKATDDEFDEVADEAIQAYKDLVDIGMNADPKYAARIFEVANSMLKTNLEAKSAKASTKLKVIEQQLKRQKQEQETKGKNSDDSNTIDGKGRIVSDRNTLMEQLKSKKSTKDANNQSKNTNNE